MKIAIIGAGNVGASCAMRILDAGLSDVVLLDVVESIAKGKAEDLMDAASLIGHNKTIIGTSDYNEIQGCEIVVITAGFARKPGMTREELLNKNANVVKEVTRNIVTHTENPIIIVVTNPLDIMSYVAYRESGLDSRRVLGMAGVLDSSRMNLMISRLLNRPIKDVNSIVLGMHGEYMVPVLSQSRLEGKKLSQATTEGKLNEIIDKTKSRGAQILSYLGTGSAFYAPSAGVLRIVRAIITDTDETFCCSCYLQGEYGLKDVYLGVPAIIGRSGIKKIVELPLSDQEKNQLNAAYDSVRSQLCKIGTGLITREHC